MEKHRKNGGNTDAEETKFFQAASSGKSTDQYDTQQLNAGQVRRQAAQQNPNNGTAYPEYGYSGYGTEAEPYNRLSGTGGNPYGGAGYNNAGGYASPNYTSYGQPNSNAGYGNSAGGGQASGYGGAGYRPQQGNGYGTSGQAQRPVQQPRRPAQPQRQPQRPAQPRNNGSAVPRQPQSRPVQNRQPVAYRTAGGQQHAPGSSGQAPSRRKKKRSIGGTLFRGLLFLIIAVFLLYSVVAMIGILSMNRVSTGDRSVTDGSLEESYVKNVLVIGTDTRDPEEERGRSDSMILVSMNSKTNELYMTSFMRDTYVEIPGQGSGKLNAAYSYGGPELLMDTLEQNFDVRIDDYVMITFAACADMIDAVGGVEIELSDSEAQAVNEILISEVNEIMGDDREDDLLDGGGTLKLDGKQALSYSRIRYVGNADFERTQRQRTVMQQVMEKAKSNPLRLASICLKALPDMTTNLSVGQLYGYALTTPFKLITYDMEQQRIPEEGTYSGADIGGESVLQIDFDAAQELLEDTVFAS